MKAIVVLSGGLDSTTALYWALEKYDVVGAISFDYDQNHKREIEYARKTIRRLNETGHNIEHRIQAIDISANRSALKNNSINIPHGHYEEETMTATVVNNRNSIMFSLATAWAIDLKADKVVVGIHTGDHAIYPDCREDFIKYFNHTMRLANEGLISEDFQVLAPFVRHDKNDIAELFLLLDGDERHTYSDYDGGEIQNAQSGTSVERIEALSIAYARIDELIAPFTQHHQNDRTQYENKDYALNLLSQKRLRERKAELLKEIDNTINYAYERTY